MLEYVPQHVSLEVLAQSSLQPPTGRLLTRPM
jgi:hypothetical protein